MRGGVRKWPICRQTCAGPLAILGRSTPGPVSWRRTQIHCLVSLARRMRVQDDNVEFSSLARQALRSLDSFSMVVVLNCRFAHCGIVNEGGRDVWTHEFSRPQSTLRMQQRHDLKGRSSNRSDDDDHIPLDRPDADGSLLRRTRSLTCGCCCLLQDVLCVRGGEREPGGAGFAALKRDGAGTEICPRFLFHSTTRCGTNGTSARNRLVT
jgi:hypothetical protein